MDTNFSKRSCAKVLICHVSAVQNIPGVGKAFYVDLPPSPHPSPRGRGSSGIPQVFAINSLSLWERGRVRGKSDNPLTQVTNTASEILGNRFACRKSPWRYPDSMIFSRLLKHVVWIANSLFWTSMMSCFLGQEWESLHLTHSFASIGVHSWCNCGKRATIVKYIMDI